MKVVPGSLYRVLHFHDAGAALTCIKIRFLCAPLDQQKTLLDDSTSIIARLQALRAAGVRVAIDDFGTGYSSLSRLSQLPIDMLKIDRSFTSRLGMDETSATVVSAIIQLANAFGMITCAEGVEMKQQLEILKTLGCQQAQGYLFSRPVPIDDVERLLRASLDDKALSPLPSVTSLSGKTLRSVGDM